MESGFIRSTDADIYYESTGEGQALTLLHGNGEDGGVFRGQVAPFSETYRVIAIDSRGHGRSGRGGLPLTLSTMAEDVCAVLRGLGIAKTHLLGFSDGGNVALTFALGHGDMLNSLMILGANLTPGGVKQHTQTVINIHYVLLCLSALFKKDAARRRDVAGLMVHSVIPEEGLAALDLPALVMAGENDMIKAAHTRRIARLLGTEAVIFSGADHFALTGQASLFNKTVLGFLRREGVSG